MTNQFEKIGFFVCMCLAFSWPCLVSFIFPSSTVWGELLIYCFLDFTTLKYRPLLQQPPAIEIMGKQCLKEVQIRVRVPREESDRGLPETLACWLSMGPQLICSGSCFSTRATRGSLSEKGACKEISSPRPHTPPTWDVLN